MVCTRGLGEADLGGLTNMKCKQNPWKTVGDDGGQGMRLQRCARVSPYRIVASGEEFGFYFVCSKEPMKGLQGKA